MLVYHIKNILSIAPEALEFIKKAELEQDFPSDSKDSVAASYLTMNYLTKVAHKPVDLDKYKKIEKAAELYNLPKALSSIVEKFEQVDLEKKAESQKIPQAEEFEMVKSYFQGSLCGFSHDLEKIAEQAETIYNKYTEAKDVPELTIYSGNGFLQKEAALGSLAARYQATKDKRFLKVARIVENTEPLEYTPDNLRKLAHTVTKLDNEYKLGTIGFNFYKEAMTKEASGVCIRLMGQQVPYEKIQKFGKDRIASILGEDVGKSLSDDIGNNKAVLESLPRDLQQLLHSHVKNC